MKFERGKVPIAVTLVGMLTDVKLVQKLKALFPKNIIMMVVI